MKIYIYGLWDPRNYRLRYIGKSNDPERRLKDHISETVSNRYSNTRKENWIKQLLLVGLKPSLEILEECTDENWELSEQLWIDECRRKGLDLTNLSDGGEGFQSGKKHPLYKKTGKSHHSYGRKMSDITKKKMSESRKGRVVSKETREKISNSLVGRKRSSWERNQISQGRTGCKVKHTETHRTKILLSLRMRQAVIKKDYESLRKHQEEYKNLVGEYHTKYVL